MSSLSWGSARAPPDASRRPQRTNSTGPPGTRLRAPPPPSSILHRRLLQPPTQPPLPQRRGGEEEEEAAGLLKRPGSPGPNRRHVSFRRAGLRRPCPLGPPATVSGAGGVSTSGVTGQSLRKPGQRLGFAGFSQPQFRGGGGIEPSGLPGGERLKTGPRTSLFGGEVTAQRTGESGRRWSRPPALPPAPPTPRAALQRGQQFDPHWRGNRVSGPVLGLRRENWK